MIQLPSSAQRRFTETIDDYFGQEVLSTLDDFGAARLRSCRGKNASEWLRVVPSTALHLALCAVLDWASTSPAGMERADILRKSR